MVAVVEEDDFNQGEAEDDVDEADDPDKTDNADARTIFGRKKSNVSLKNGRAPPLPRPLDQMNGHETR